MNTIIHDGRSIHLEAFHMGRTYAGVLEGSPKPEHIYQSAQERLTRVWGNNRPILIVEGPLDERDHLPEYECMAWLESDALDDGDGSYLFLIWYTDEIQEPVPGLCLEALGRAEVKWAEQAKDWWV